jgi:3-deoxy-D-arabino-heptulosonate 7-phosphate (DAHP) synthase
MAEQKRGDQREIFGVYIKSLLNTIRQEKVKGKKLKIDISK